MLSPLGLVDAGPIVFQRVFISQVQSLRVGCLIQGTNPMPLRGKLQFVSSLLAIGVYTKGGVYGKTASQPLLPTSMYPFLFDIEGALLCLFRRNCSIYSCRFLASLGGGEFKVFLHYHLGLPPFSRPSNQDLVGRVPFSDCILYYTLAGG